MIGRYKIWLNRLQSYLGPVNFIMILYLAIRDEPFYISWQVWTILIIIGLILILVIDIIVIFPSEQVYSCLKNPEWMEMREDLEEIKKLVREHP